jgi:hypothetical protein
VVVFGGEHIVVHRNQEAIHEAAYSEYPNDSADNRSTFREGSDQQLWRTRLAHVSFLGEHIYYTRTYGPFLKRSGTNASIACLILYDRSERYPTRGSGEQEVISGWGRKRHCTGIWSIPHSFTADIQMQRRISYAKSENYPTVPEEQIGFTGIPLIWQVV